MAKIPSRFPQKAVPKFKSASEVQPFLIDLKRQLDQEYAILSDAINNPASPVATANLPAGSSFMDGQLIIEIAAGPALNLIIYAGGVRARLTGVVF